MKKVNIIISIAILMAMSLVSCNKFLDREPLDQVTPEVYLRSVSDLSAYTIAHYNFPTHKDWNAGTFIYDNNTDNQAAVNPSKIWVKGEWRVGAAGGAWNFGQIRELNYFIENVKRNYANKEINGNDADIRHFLGEAYFLRAYQYFNKLRIFGDFPIIRNTLPDNKEVLIEASKRQPRNKVARFIISDLDSAIMLMKDNPVYNKNRLSKQVAQLFKSRVALHEGTWLKYHKGTARVPGGSGWPGASFHSGFSINIDAEISYFLGEAMSAAKAVGDNVALVESSGGIKGNSIFTNPYFLMFGALDMSSYSEILLWRDYDAQFVAHHTMHYLTNGASTGYTKNFVETFLMENGLPIYAAGSGYAGDDAISMVKQNRDHRLQLFMASPGDTLIYEKDLEFIAPYPTILEKPENRAVTGYNIKKGLYGAESKYLAGANSTETGCIVFRATEAYLNYIEAVYEKTGSIDGVADVYWKKLRRRAGLPEDYNITIGATDLSQEKDWAKYSGASMVDATLYNIRRERRCEFIAEGMRMNDLKRWRALDNVQNYIIEGFKLWGPMQDEYKNDEGKSTLRARPEGDPNVSPKSASLYLRPYQIVEANNKFFDGYTWTQAHYLSPIAFEHFLIASKDGNVSSSVIYQNPGWPVAADGLPTN